MRCQKLLRQAAGCLVLSALVAFGSDCSKKKKEKEPPLKPLRIEGLKVKFEDDLPKTSRITVEYKTFGAKYVKKGGQWEGEILDRWQIRDEENNLLWAHKLPQKFKVPSADAELNTSVVRQEVGKVLRPGTYTFKVRVLDRNSTRIIKKHITVVKGDPKKVASKEGAAKAVATREGASKEGASKEGTTKAVKPPPKPKGYKTLPVSGLYVKLPRRTKIKKAKDGKNDLLKFKKGAMDIIAANASMTLKAHIKITKKLRGYKKFITKKKGPGKGFTAIHRMKVKRKKFLVFTRVLERRNKLWSCIGRTKKKRLIKKFRKTCESLK